MKFSVIIPTKNEENYLPKLLKSIKNQTILPDNIIIADFNSVDKTQEIAKKENCIIVPGGLPAIGRNNGAEKAIELGSELLIFIDSDALLPTNNFFEKAIKEIIKRKLDIAGTLIKNQDASLKFNNICFSIFYRISNFFFLLFQYGKNPLMQICMFSKSKVHKKINGFGNLEFGEDSDYSKKAVNAGFKFRILKNTKKILGSPRRLHSKGIISSTILYIKLDLKCIFGHKFTIQKKRVYFKGE